MAHQCTYDVFLSFRGEDIRRRFIGHLYKALRGRGLHTFLDDEELDRGEDITRSLVKAIEESRIAIPVFSPNYATSTFCLDELVKIMGCSDSKGQMVLPVFYEVDPSHVRHQTGSFREALAKHEQRFKHGEGSSKVERNMERLEKWKVALTRAANLSGHHFKQGETEHEFIEEIVRTVSERIRRLPLQVGDHLVGLEPQVQKVNSLLDVGSDDVAHMVGIHGIGGIGKTTLARAVYNSIAESFEGACFLGNVRENSVTYGLIHLQEMLLSKLVGERDIRLGDVNEGITMIKHRLSRKKVLLVVDDVDTVKQLQAIVGNSRWFGSGSRIIITTRNKALLAIHGVKRTYQVEQLNDKEALDLLRLNAFKNGQVDESYANILNSAITFASGLPLALEVIGSNLFGKSKEEWESALEQYVRIPEKHIQQILKVSFDDLEEDEKKFFLDIACFFNRYRLEYVEEMLRAHHGVSPKNGIRVLVDKSLVKTEDDNVTLHDLIQEMGREIARKECNRMWFFEDIKRVFEEDKGSSKLEIIKLVFPKFDDKVNWDGEAFKKMDNLKTLIIGNGRFSEGPKHLPNSLRVLEWQAYPSQILPPDFYPKKLVILELPDSYLESLKLLKTHENFMNLRVLNFDWCQFIEEIPDISVVPNLEELSFCWCKNLNGVHKSVGLLDKLKMLDAEGCSMLRSFPPIKLTNLESMDLSYCSNLENFPEILGKMEKLTKLELYNTPIKEFPFSILYLTRLQRLELWHSGIVQLPTSIFVMTELKHLSIGQCDELHLHKQEEDEEQEGSMEFPNQEHFDFSGCNATNEFLQIGVPWFANVKMLHLSWNNFTILPASIKECFLLKELFLDHCQNLQEIKGIPPNIETFSARDCRSLKSLDLTLLPANTKECQFLKKLILDGCVNLLEIRGIPLNIEVLNAPKCTSLTSSWRSMLSDQDIHKEGFWLSMPNTNNIPEWFNYSCKGSSISFWFRSKFPTTFLCVISAQSFTSFSPKLIINGHELDQLPVFLIEKDHILILDLGQKLIKLKDEVNDVLLKNEWNQVELYNDPAVWRAGAGGTVQIGLYVLKESGSMEDIRFTDPLLSQEEKRLDDMGHSQTQVMQDLHAESACTIGSTNDIASPDDSAKAPRESSRAAAMPHAQDTQAPSPTSSSSEVSIQEIYIETSCTIWPTTFEDSFENQVPVVHEDVETEASCAGSGLTPQDHLEKAPSESSQAPAFAETKDTQASSHTSIGKVSGQEIHAENLPTAFGESLRNQVIWEDAEMEEFYASLDAWNHVLSHSHDELATTTPGKEAKEALKTVQDFISSDASLVLLHPEQCSIMKSTLDYLSSLSADDGISGEMKTLISEASGLFTHWSRDYIEASSKVESTTSELVRADNLEASLEANKNQFREVVALENELLKKLARIEKSKKELELQINAIKANLSTCESEKNMILQRKRDIFEEGKTLKAQIEELRGKIPHLQQEQGLAKKTLANIASEWSKVGEKFKTIVVD